MLKFYHEFTRECVENIRVGDMVNMDIGDYMFKDEEITNIEHFVDGSIKITLVTIYIMLTPMTIEMKLEEEAKEKKAMEEDPYHLEREIPDYSHELKAIVEEDFGEWEVSEIETIRDAPTPIEERICKYAWVGDTIVFLDLDSSETIQERIIAREGKFYEDETSTLTEHFMIITPNKGTMAIVTRDKYNSTLANVKAIDLIEREREHY